MLMLDTLESCCHTKPRWRSQARPDCSSDCGMCVHPPSERQRRQSFLEICTEEFEFIGELMLQTVG